MSNAFDIRGDKQEGVEGEALALDLEAEHRPEVARKASMAGLRQVQKKASGEGERGSVQESAARGVASATTALPHGDKIQAAFGGHDLSHIQAHVGGNTASEMGANAYASGHHVVFDRAPDLHTAAHEVAHVVQQAKGVNLYGGVGEAGDVYEQQADAIADRVVAGQSATDLLGAPQSAGAASEGAVQLDKGSAKKPGEATDAERTEAHQHAGAVSAGAMGSTMTLVARRMFSAAKHIDHLSRQKAGGEGGSSQIMAQMRQHMKDVEDDLVMLELYMAGFTVRGSADDNLNGKLGGQHSGLSSKLQLLKSAHLEYQTAINTAKRYGDEAKDPLEPGTLDKISGKVKPLFEKFGRSYDEYDGTALPFKDASVGRADDAQLKGIEKLDAEVLEAAVKSNIAAALSTAQALRMEVKGGSKGDRSNDARQLASHVRELADLVGDQDKAHKKSHSVELKELLKEIEAVQAELGGHEEVKSVLMNSGGTFGTNLAKLKAATK